MTGRGRPAAALALIDTLRYGQPSPLPSTASSDVPAPDAANASCAPARVRALAAVGLAEQLATYVEPAHQLDDAWSGLRAARAGAGIVGRPAANAIAKAELNVTKAQAAVVAAAELANGCPAPRPGTQATAVTDLMALTDPGAAHGTDPGDSVNAVKAVTSAARGCDAAVTIPSVEAPTKAQTKGKSWDVVLTTQLEPLQATALAILVLVVALLVIARLASRLVPEASSPGTQAARRFARVVGVLGIGAASAIGVLVSPTSGRQVAVLAALALLSVGLLAWADAWELSLAVTVSDRAGSEQQAFGAQIVALLGELGAAEPRGIRTPRGTDMTDLEDAGLDAVPSQALAKLAWSILRLIRPRAPWRARVDVVSADLQAVSVSHNGHPVLTTLVDRDVLRLRATEGRDATPGDAPDLYRMTAAAILCALHEKYHFQGLPPSADWRSVGYHYLATTQLRTENDRAVELLARAVDVDPANTTARVALWSMRHRTAKDIFDLRLYLDFLVAMGAELSTATDPRHPDYALRLRTTLNCAVTAVNLAYATDPKRSPHHEIKAAKEACKLGLELTSESRVAGTPVALLARQIRPLLLAIEPVAKGILPESKFPAPRDSAATPFSDYTWGCTYATFAAGRPLPSNRDALVAEAIRRLSASDADPENAAWRAKDPQLKQLRELPAYREAFITVPTFAEKVAPFADKLSALGIKDANDLRMAASGTRNRFMLALKLGTVPAMVRRLVTRARAD